jgi:hypothetical protein
MEIGELFRIEDSRLNLEQRVLWAAKRYERKYGQQPNLAMAHPSVVEGARNRLGSLRIEARKSVLPNYVWVGVTQAVLTPLAR